MHFSIKNKKAEAETTLDVLFGLAAGAFIFFMLVSKAGMFSQEAEQTDEIIANEIRIHLNTLASIPYPAELTTQTKAIIKPDGIYINGEKTGMYNLQKGTNIHQGNQQETLTLAHYYGELEIGGTLEELESIPKIASSDYELKIDLDINVNKAQIKTILNKYNQDKDNPELRLIIVEGEQNTVKCFRVTGLCEAIRIELSKKEPGFYGSEQIQEEISTVRIETTGFIDPVAVGNVIDTALREAYVA